MGNARWTDAQLAEWRRHAELAWAALPPAVAEAKSRRHWVPAYMGSLAARAADGRAGPSPAKLVPVSVLASAPAAAVSPARESAAFPRPGPSAAGPRLSAGRYRRAVLARFGRLPDDARMWLTLAARLIESLDDVHGEVEAARRTLRDGATRRARERARGTMRKLERQTARLRASLAHCERRVAALATGPTESGQVDPLAAVRQAVAEANQP